MDNEKFDGLARAFSGKAASRRKMLRRGVAAALAGLSGGSLTRTKRASAHHCDWLGCGCATGTQHPCGDGLVCCPSSPGTPGGAGVCAPAGECGGQCVYWGDACPGYCNWGDTCPDCCSGYCGQFGTCMQYGYGM